MSKRPEAIAVRIREYDETLDSDGIRRCVIELQDYERGFDPRMPEGSSIADAYMKNLLDECLRNAGRIFVAEDEGTVVGYVSVWARTRSDDVSEGAQEYALVHDLVVLPGHRRRGIGRRLLKTSESYARRHRAKYLRISALAANSGARALYTDLGFEELEIVFEKELMLTVPEQDGGGE